MRRRRVAFFFIIFTLTTLVVLTLCHNLNSDASHCTAGWNNGEHSKMFKQTPSISIPTDSEKPTTLEDSITQQHHQLLKDIFISIKTTQRYHSTRLPVILQTWLTTVTPENVSQVLYQLYLLIITVINRYIL